MMGVLTAREEVVLEQNYNNLSLDQILRYECLKLQQMRNRVKSRIIGIESFSCPSLKTTNKSRNYTTHKQVNDRKIVKESYVAEIHEDPVKIDCRQGKGDRGRSVQELTTRKSRTKRKAVRRKPESKEKKATVASSKSGEQEDGVLGIDDEYQKELNVTKGYKKSRKVQINKLPQSAAQPSTSSKQIKPLEDETQQKTTPSSTSKQKKVTRSPERPVTKTSNPSLVLSHGKVLSSSTGSAAGLGYEETKAVELKQSVAASTRPSRERAYNSNFHKNTSNALTGSNKYSSKVVSGSASKASDYITKASHHGSTAKPSTAATKNSIESGGVSSIQESLKAKPSTSDKPSTCTLNGSKCNSKTNSDSTVPQSADRKSKSGNELEVDDQMSCYCCCSLLTFKSTKPNPNNKYMCHACAEENLEGKKDLRYQHTVTSKVRHVLRDSNSERTYSSQRNYVAYQYNSNRGGNKGVVSPDSSLEMDSDEEEYIMLERRLYLQDADGTGTLV